MKIGIALPTSHQGVYLPSPFADGQELIAIAQAAERFGIDSAWVLDFMTPFYERHRQPDQLPQWYEAMVSLGYIASATRHIRLGTATIQLPLRDPFLLARQAATLDVLSGGRVALGVGLGQARSEFTGMRPLDAGRHRGALLDESLAVLHQFFSSHAVSFEGDHYRCHDLRLTPRTCQAPLPIYLAGTSERTPERVAKWAAGWFLSRAQTRDVNQPIDALSICLEREGRTLHEIDLVVTKGLSLARTHEQAMAQFNASMLPGRMNELALEYGLEDKTSFDRVLSQNLIGPPDAVAEQLDQVHRSGVNHCAIMYFAVRAVDELLEQLQWFGEEVLPLLSWHCEGYTHPIVTK